MHEEYMRKGLHTHVVFTLHQRPPKKKRPYAASKCFYFCGLIYTRKRKTIR